MPGRFGERKAVAPGASARVHSMAAGEQLGGPNAMGKPGDWVLENDEVVFVVDGLGGGAGFAESGGNVIDAADAKTRKDELGQIFTYFGTFPRQGVYGSIDAKMDGAVAVLEARGKELYEPSVEVVTDYRLAGGDRALLMETTLTNKGTAKVTGLALGDAIQWGATEKLAPGKSVGFHGRSSGPYVGGVGRFVSYGITSTEGEIAALSGGSWTDTEQKKVDLAPGEAVTYRRVFVVGERPDVASIVSELTKTSAGEIGALEIALTSSSGAPVKVPAGAKVVLGTATSPEIMTIVATREGDTFGGELPPGKWLVGYAPSAGRRAVGQKAMVEVKQGAASRVALAVSDPASVVLGPCGQIPLGANETSAPTPTPCKLTIEGMPGTPTPDFGPPHVAGLAKNVVMLRPAEQATVPLPYGRYRVTASRGPAFDLASIELAVPGPAPAPFRLRRVVDTSGYVASDFHQHSILSADAPVGTRDRVLANAAEGLELAVASEHNAIADLAPIAKELGLSPFIVQIAGDELTSDASRKPFGHANVFPVVPEPDKPRGGALAVRERSASDVFADARALPGGPHVLQINHPRAGKNGYFDLLAFDSKTGVGTGAGYDAAFDAIEVWNGRVVRHRTAVLEDYFALLRTGHPTTPIADTDTHGIVGEEPGYPRTFVRVPHALADGALDQWDGARTQELVRTVRETRDVVLTNGPFLRVSAKSSNTAPIGGLVRGGSVQVSVNVSAPSWIAVERAEIRLARATAPPPVTLAPKKGAKGAMEAEATFSLRLTQDDAFVVIVSGTMPMRPVLSGEDADIAPWAMSAPIWVDVDGDGASLGRRRSGP
jgi:hypothetical protein